MKNIREWTFIFLLTWVSVFLLVKSGNWWVGLVLEQYIKLSLHENYDSIKNLDSPRNIKATETIYVSTLHFPESNELTHYDFGGFDYFEDFFMDAEVNFFIKKENNYEFIISSDDGFRLLIDNQLVCEFIENRPMQKTHCRFFITAGKHKLSLNYYQGYGRQGLTAKYKLASASESIFIGKDSEYIDFIPLDKE